MTLHVVAISPYLPYPPDHGGRIRTYHLFRELVRRGHRVDLVALTDRAEESANVAALAETGIAVHPILHPRRFGALAPVDRVRKLKNLARGRSDVLRRFDSEPAHRLAREVAGADCDVVIAQTLWTAPIALTTPAAHRVLDAQNVEHRVAAQTAADASGWTSRWLTGLEAAGLERDERELVHQFDAVVTVSEADRDELAALAPGPRGIVVPNCIDTETRRVLPPPTSPGPECLFVGSANYPPNARAIEWFVGEVFPRVRDRHPAARFVAVGADPPETIRRLGETVAGVRIAGYAEDLDACYASAGIAVVPITIGGGTRTKILEALAVGRPVVTTTVGAAGLDLTHGEEILVADEPRAFADAVLEIAGEPTLAARLGERGRAWVERSASARASGGALETFLLELTRSETAR